METVQHELPPVFDENSRVLILGSLPSPRSRQIGFYYGHPQNRFWGVLSAVLGESIPTDPAGKRQFLLEHHIALWDVIASCEIVGAQDASIRNVTANDLSVILRAAPVRTIFTTGKTAAKWYNKLLLPQTGIQAVVLPSPSPANCAVSAEQLVAAYRQIADALR